MSYAKMIEGLRPVALWSGAEVYVKHCHVKGHNEFLLHTKVLKTVEPMPGDATTDDHFAALVAEYGDIAIYPALSDEEQVAYAEWGRRMNQVGLTRGLDTDGKDAFITHWFYLDRFWIDKFRSGEAPEQFVEYYIGISTPLHNQDTTNM
jgi:hypothetical protein